MNCNVCGSSMVEMILSSFCPECEKVENGPITKSIFKQSIRPVTIAPSQTAIAKGLAGNWNLDFAVAACRDIEDLIRPLGFHVALTGGTLYKDGWRKDMDLFIYPHIVANCKKLDKKSADTIVQKIANMFCTTWTRNSGYCYQDDKTVYKLGNNIDLFLPYTDF